MLKELTTEEFNNEVLNGKGETIVMYSQTTCMPCKFMEAQLLRLVEEKGMNNIVKVNLTNTPELNDESFLGDKVMSTPSVFIFQDGKMIKDYRGGQAMELIAELS